ncbi:MAG: hypothetical protein FWB78_05930 [Treponema sp.]|nr:hypothetical protein [Treponema sp.]
MSCVPLSGRLYQPVPGFENHLIAELQKPSTRIGQLFHDQDLAVKDDIFWYQNCWLEPFRLEFSSINEAATFLRSIQRNWAACLHTCFRRGSLIASKLPPISAKPRPFPWLLGETPVGAWTLLDERTLIASARCSSPFPNGAIEFEQDKEGPPSRAYLKLWEALVRLRQWPSQGERCLDLGASPGGWTWALARLGANVIAVDQAPLEDRIAALPGVECLRRDAFTLKPEDIGPVDWLFCDLACYPPRLYDWIEKWIASGLCRKFVCTIKMQGTVGTGNVDFETPKRFARIPESMLVHLYHNKHELTWMFCG